MLYRRIEAMAKVGYKLRVLDLTDPEEREAVAVYGGMFASDY